MMASARVMAPSTPTGDSLRASLLACPYRRCSPPSARPPAPPCLAATRPCRARLAAVCPPACAAVPCRCSSVPRTARPICSPSPRPSCCQDVRAACRPARPPVPPRLAVVRARASPLLLQSFAEGQLPSLGPGCRHRNAGSGRGLWSRRRRLHHPRGSFPSLRTQTSVLAGADGEAQPPVELEDEESQRRRSEATPRRRGGRTRRGGPRGTVSPGTRGPRARRG